MMMRSCPCPGLTASSRFGPLAAGAAGSMTDECDSSRRGGAAGTAAGLVPAAGADGCFAGAEGAGWIAAGREGALILPSAARDGSVCWTFAWPSRTASSTSVSSRVRVRSARRDGLEALKKAQKEGGITEDDLERYEKDVQKLTDKYVAEVDRMLAAKEQELMQV